MKPYLLIFDVESTHLFGEGFAVGAIVFDRNGNEIDRFELLSNEGILKAGQWVKENVLPYILDMPRCNTNLELRNSFYNFYLKYKDNSEIWCDCGFPVETNFLNQIVNDDLEERQWKMPYPLKDISTLIDIDIDRAKECGLEGLRKHNPFDDSLSSGICLLKYLKEIR